jgi:Matrixin
MQLTAQVTVFAGVKNTVKSDLRRTETVFGAVPLWINSSLFTITPEATKSMLGTDGALAITGDPQEFEVTDPMFKTQVRVQDPNGRFTQEVWNAIRDWTNFGGVRIFYVKKFENTLKGIVQGSNIVVGRTIGITLQTGGVFDPVIFIDQEQNLDVLRKTRGRFGLLEHEIGHALGLDHSQSVGDLMFAFSDERSGNRLTAAEIDTVRRSSLLTADPAPWTDFPDSRPAPSRLTA